MNYTENYQLPQWVESDRVLMEDFNDTNAKVDQALAENKEFCTNFVKLRETVSSGNTTQLDINVADLNLSQYCCLLVDVQLNGGAGAAIRFNSSMSCTAYIIGSMTTGSALGFAGDDGVCTVVLFCGKNADRMPFGFYQNKEGLGVGRYNSGITYRTAATLNLVGSSTSSIASGSRVSIWGLR